MFFPISFSGKQVKRRLCNYQSVTRYVSGTSFPSMYTSTNEEGVGSRPVRGYLFGNQEKALLF